MKKLFSFTVVLLFFLGLILAPPVGELDLMQDIREEKKSTLSEGVARNIRIAIYDEADTSPTGYCACPHFSNNIELMSAFLIGAGYAVTQLSTNDILNHELLTAKFDVFILVNNIPRNSIYNYVYEYWLGGGGILSFNGGFGFLQYSGIFSPDWAGADEYLDEWLFLCDATIPTYNYTILNRHSTCKSYHQGDVFEAYINDTVVWNPGYTGLSNAAEFTPIAAPSAYAVLGCMLAIEPANRAGGRAVQLAGNGSYIEPGLESIIIDSVNWLIPRPKGRIVYDLSHHPRLGVDSWDTMCAFPGYMSDLRDRLEVSGYTVDKLYESTAGNLTLARLSSYDMLILLSPDRNYTAPEITAVGTWTTNGGGLLVLGESPLLPSFEKCTDQINWLMDGFDMTIAMIDYDSVTGLYAEHPISEGCSNAPYNAVGFVNYTGDAFRITYDGPNTFIAGQTYGSGRAILGADMNFACNLEIGDASNTPFVRNIANWLTAATAKILYFTNEPYADYGMTPGALALNDLGADYYTVFTSNVFNMSLYMYSWDLVIADVPWNEITSYLDDINNYLNTGKRLIMSYYFANNAPDHPLWSRIGFEVAADVPSSSMLPTYIWEASNGIFNLPNDYNAANFTPFLSYGDEGDYLTVFSNATALVGFTSTSESGNASVVLGLNGRVLYNAFLIDEYTGDVDDSTYADNFELWENEIAFMLQPSIDHPSDVEFEQGTTGHSIVWTPHSDRPWRYKITQDSVTVISVPWSGSSISISIDGLNNGTYSYGITVYDTAGYSAIDMVIVNVTVMPTNTTGTGQPLDITTLLVVIAGVGVVLVIVIIVLKKKK